MSNNTQIESIEDVFTRLYKFYKVDNNAQLSKAMKMSRNAISAWKIRSSVSAIKKRCLRLGVYNEIFGASSSLSNEKKVSNGDLSEYFIALQSVASAMNKEDELIEDIKILIKKYIGV